MNETQLEVERQEMPDGSTMLLIHAHKCGMTFPSVAIVFDATSKNPLIQIPKPLGRGAVKKILELL